MPLMISLECPGCQRFERTGDLFHEKDEWEKYHKSGGVSDWQPREEIQDLLNEIKKSWLEVQKMRVQTPDTSIPEWKLKKILNKRCKI